MLCDPPHATEASAKIETPTEKTRRLPKRSPIEPPMRSRDARRSAYDSTTHWTSWTVAFRFACNAGSETLTTVPSMKAMLEPRIVAARTHGSARFMHGDEAAPDLITPSSHGGVKMFPISRVWNAHHWK